MLFLLVSLALSACPIAAQNASISSISALFCTAPEVFKACRTYCEPSCRVPNPICITLCKPNVCQCADGYVRNDSGVCVRQSQCANPSGVQCGTNEVYRECGSHCEPTCRSPSPWSNNPIVTGVQNLLCLTVCKPKVCQCSQGFVRNDSGRCVLPSQCQAQCGENESLKSCGAQCEPTCLNPNPICPAVCIANVCQCSSGFVRNPSGKCVPQSQCPAMCGENETLKTCGSRCEGSGTVRKRTFRKFLMVTITCFQCFFQFCAHSEGKISTENGTCETSACETSTCETSHLRNVLLTKRLTCETSSCEPSRSRCEPSCNNTSPLCPAVCVPNVCQCSLGFVRNSAGKCVAQSQCRTQCGENETFKTCGSRCEPSCTNPNPICPAVCVPNVCQCSTGFVRNSSGKCVRNNQCSTSTQCRANETFKTCGTACEPSCRNPNPQSCTEQCVLNVCQCSPGFVRGPFGCIRSNQC